MNSQRRVAFAGVGQRHVLIFVKVGKEARERIQRGHAGLQCLNTGTSKLSGNNDVHMAEPNNSTELSIAAMIYA